MKLEVGIRDLIQQGNEKLHEHRHSWFVIDDLGTRRLDVETGLVGTFVKEYYATGQIDGEPATVSFVMYPSVKGQVKSDWTVNGEWNAKHKAFFGKRDPNIVKRVNAMAKSINLRQFILDAEKIKHEQQLLCSMYNAPADSSPETFRHIQRLAQLVHKLNLHGYDLQDFFELLEKYPHQFRRMAEAKIKHEYEKEALKPRFTYNTVTD